MESRRSMRVGRATCMLFLLPHANAIHEASSSVTTSSLLSPYAISLLTDNARASGAVLVDNARASDAVSGDNNHSDGRIANSVNSAPPATCENLGNDCYTCVTASKATINGAACAWCPTSFRCYDIGAANPNRNPCTLAESYTKESQCNVPQYTYSDKIANALLIASAAAYTDDPSMCMTRMPGDFVVQDTVSVKCDFAQQTCAGFTSVSTSQEVVLLSFRGTASDIQLLVEALVVLNYRRPWVGGGNVLDYFDDAYTAMKPLVDQARALLVKYPAYKLWVTGHSLGAALASLAASDLVTTGAIAKSNVVLYTYGMPRVGDYWYASNHYIAVPHSFRLVNANDVIPHVPWCNGGSIVHTVKSCIGPLNPLNGSSPYHVGTEVWYARNTTKAFTNGDRSYYVCDQSDPRTYPYSPTNEALECSNGRWLNEDPLCLSGTCISDHLTYLGIYVSQYCKDNGLA